MQLFAQEIPHTKINIMSFCAHNEFNIDITSADKFERLVFAFNLSDTCEKAQRVIAHKHGLNPIPTNLYFCEGKLLHTVSIQAHQIEVTEKDIGLSSHCEKILQQVNQY
jgi:hypothetical protein